MKKETKSVRVPPLLCECAGEGKWWLGEHRPPSHNRAACPLFTPYEEDEDY